MINRNSNSLSVLLFSIGLILCFVYFFLPITSFSTVLFDVGTVVVAVCIWLFFRHSQKSVLKDYWLKPSNLFVNFQFLLDYRLGLKDDLSNHIIYPMVLNQCFLLGLVGFVAFTAGYLRTTSLKSELGDGNRYERVSRLVKNIRVPVIILHLLSFVAFLITIDFEAFLSGESYAESTATYAHIEKLLGTLNVLVVICAAVKASVNGSLKTYFSSFSWISLVVLGAYMILRLISGDRGPFVYTTILLFYGYAYVTRKQYRLIPTILVLTVGAMSMSVIGIARSLDLSQGFIERVGDAGKVFSSSGRFADKSVSPMTEELGFSFVVNQTDVNAIEVEKNQLHPGTYLLISLLNGIPMVPGLITRLFHISYEDFSSTGFANVHFFGYEERTWSIGTTIVGDFYLQFSVFGVFLGLFLTGLLMKLIDLTLYKKDRSTISFLLLLFTLAYSSKALYLPRSLLLGEMSTFIMALIIVLLLRVLVPKRIEL